MDRLEHLYTGNIKLNGSLTILNHRLGNNLGPERYHPDTIPAANHMAHMLGTQGGFAQQSRMIKDKRKTLDKVVKYSYQGAWVKRWASEYTELMDGERDKPPVRALINPNKLKQDYDDKIISVGYEYGFQPGDVFEWCNTHTYWLIYLQDLTELAYFRGDIRKCSYEIEWEDEEGRQKTYVAVRGPVETKINYIQKHLISVDRPNYSLDILMPKTPASMRYFTRYAKFYLRGAEDPDSGICWRVEATDSISMPGVLEVQATEYYANKDEDDIENGLVGTLIAKEIDPNPTDAEIIGETFIKPKREYVYHIDANLYGGWYVEDAKNIPVHLEEFTDEEGRPSVKVKWLVSYTGQFNIWYGDENGPLLNYKKTIVVESLF